MFISTDIEAKGNIFHKLLFRLESLIENPPMIGTVLNTRNVLVDKKWKVISSNENYIYILQFILFQR